MNRFTVKQPDETYHVYDLGIIQEINCCDENNKNWFSLYEGAAIDKLGKYEDEEEQGLLLRLPCKVGDTVWAITSPINLGFDEDESLRVYECVIESITFYKNRNHQIRLYSGGVFVVWYVRLSDFGKLVFLTKEEADKALEEM